MRKLVVAAAACASMLLTGYDCAFADPQKDKTETLPLHPVTRSIDYPAPDDRPVTSANNDSPVESDNPYAALIAKYAVENDVPVDLANAVVQIESHFNAKMRGNAGEIGLMQVKPATAKLMGYTGSVKGLYDPETNIRFGMKYLAKARMLGGGPTCNTILKYNAGHSATHMNPHSQEYCGKVLALLD